MHIRKDLRVDSICGIHAISLTSSKEAVVINLNDSSFYLWENLVTMESFSVEDVAILLEKEYEVDHVTALADSKTLLDNWLDLGIALP